MNFKDAFDISSIQMEPRLQEYVRRKQFNKDNNIKPDIPEEQEFYISNNDLKIINKFKSGKTKVYTNKQLAKSPDLVKPFAGGAITDNYFLKDKRYMRIVKKMESHNKAREQISNLDLIDPEYTIFHQPLPIRDDRIMTNSKDMMNKKKPQKFNPNSNAYHHPPKIAYKQRLSESPVSGGLSHNHTINNVIGNIDNYTKHLNGGYDYDTNIMSNVDVATKTFTPGSKSKSRRETYNNYQAIPYMYGSGMPDITLEESLRGSVSDSSRKSMGFKSSFGHNFNYISSDIYDPNHTVQMWPQNTRGQNKEIARKNSSAVQSEKRFVKKIIH